MKIECLMHVPFETPAAIDIWAEQRSHTLSTTLTPRGGPLPDIDEFEMLVVLGGPQSAVNLDAHPYLTREVSLIRDAMAAHKLVVGFCLGAQLIGAAAGSPASNSESREVGMLPIELMDAGIADPVLSGLPQSFEVLHWHADMPGLASDATLLARSRGCSRQAFRLNERTYAFQFHLEATRASIELLLDNAPQDLAPDRFVQTRSQILSADFDLLNRRLFHVMDRVARL